MPTPPPALDPCVAATFARFEPAARDRILALRALVLHTAAAQGCGPVTEGLAWGQPSYRVHKAVGTPVRFGARDDGSVAVFVHCQTEVLGRIQVAHGPDTLPKGVSFEGTRALVLAPGVPTDLPVVRDMVKTALTYRRGERSVAEEVG